MPRLILAVSLALATVPAAAGAQATTGSCPEAGHVRSPLVMNYTCSGLAELAAAIGPATSDQTVSGFACTQRPEGGDRAWTCISGSGADEQRAMWVYSATPAPAAEPSPGGGSSECPPGEESIFCGTTEVGGPGTQDESRPGGSGPGSSGATRSCPGSGPIQGLAAIRTTCAVARRTARAVGDATAARRANGFGCRISNETSAGRGWTCTRRRSGRRQAVSWVFVR